MHVGTVIIFLFAAALVIAILCAKAECPQRCPICASANIGHYRQDGLALCLNCGVEFLDEKK